MRNSQQVDAVMPDNIIFFDLSQSEQDEKFVFCTRLPTVVSSSINTVYKLIIMCRTILSSQWFI